MAAQTTRTVLRYQASQRLMHWLGAGAFIVLLLTGLILLWPPLSPLAAGGASRLLHRVGAIGYILWPILYAVLNPKKLRDTVVESVTFTRDDVAWFKHAIEYFLGDTSKLPPQGRVNAGQKIHHLGVGLTSFFIVGSGLALWLGVGKLGASALGIVTMVHDLSMLALTVLLIGHLYFTFVYGALTAMLKGRVTEEYARMEHPKWLEELPESAFVVETPHTEAKETPPAAPA